MKFRAKHPFAKDPSRTFGPVVNKSDQSSNHYDRPQYEKPHGPLSKSEMRERKRQRQAQKPYGQLRVDLNHLGTSVLSANKRGGRSKRLKDQSRNEQHKFVGVLIEKMKGNIRNIVYKADSTRILQTAIKYGSHEHHLAILAELRGRFIDLSTERYAHHTVRRLLEFGRGEVRTVIVRELTWACTRLILHRIACSVTDYAIMVAADCNQRRRALQCFVSMKFHKSPAMEEDPKGEGQRPCSLETILMAKGLRKKDKQSMLKQMKRFLISGFEKEIMSSGVFQVILYHFVHHSFHRHSKMVEMAELMVPMVMHLQNVKAGVKAVLHLVNYAVLMPNALRKQLVRNLSPCTVSMSCDKDSYLVVIRLLDVLDDVNFLRKNVIKHVVANWDIFLYDLYARKVIFHLLEPRSEWLREHHLYHKLCLEPIQLTQQKREKLENFQKEHGHERDSDDDDDDNDKMKDDEESKEDEGPISGDVLFGRNKKNGEEDAEEDSKALDVISEVKMAAFLDPNTVPNCKKDWKSKRKQVLQMVLPSLVEYCTENMKKVMSNHIAGGFLETLMRTLLSDDLADLELKKSGKKKENTTTRALADEMIKSVVDVSLIDWSPREVSPEPVEPRPPATDEVEVQNVVEDSMKLVDGKTTKGMNLASVDLSQMDPHTARNIMKLQQLEAATKQEAESLVKNAEFQIKRKKYHLKVMRQRGKTKKLDMGYGMMWHVRAQKRLRALLAEFEPLRALFVETLLDEDKVNEETLWSFLDLVQMGVRVFATVFENANDKNKKRLKAKLKPICQSIKEKFIPDDVDKDVKAAFDQLCDGMGI